MLQCKHSVHGCQMSLINAVYQYNNTLVVDVNHEAPATAQASFNFVRCTFAALVVAFLESMMRAVGFGFSFTIIGGCCVISAILYRIELNMGMKWRIIRYRRADRTVPVEGNHALQDVERREANE
jgi:hypothetical protein